MTFLNFLLFILPFVINAIFVLIGGVFALHERQFRSWRTHGGTWSNLLFIGLSLIYIMPYYNTWNSSTHVVAGCLSAIITVFYHQWRGAYTKFPEHIIGKEEKFSLKLTTGGWYHMFYMFLVLHIFICFYFRNMSSASYPMVGALMSIYPLPAFILTSRYYRGRTILSYINTVIVWIIIWVPYFKAGTLTGLP